MSCIEKNVIVGITICIFAWMSPTFAAQEIQSGMVNNHSNRLAQNRNDIAALPASPDILNSPSESRANAPVPGDPAQRYTSFPRQASAQTSGYDYPVAGGPQVKSQQSPAVSNDAKFQSEAAARVTDQILNGTYFLTGHRVQLSPSIGQRPISAQIPTPVLPAPTGATSPTAVTNPTTPYVAPIPSQNIPNRSTSYVPTAYAIPQRTTTTSRSPVEQQVSSTMSVPKSVPGFATTAQQAQAQATQLAQKAQAQQALAQQTLAQAWQAQARAAQLSRSQTTTAFRQPVYQQPVYQQTTLGLNNQNVGSAQLTANNSAYSTALYAPPVKYQNMPAGTYWGTGIVGQPTAYRDGQPLRNLFRFITP